MADTWAKLWVEILRKPKVRREVQDHGASTPWLWVVCVLLAKSSGAKGRIEVEPGMPMRPAEIREVSCLGEGEFDRALAVLLRWGSTRVGRWLSRSPNDGCFLVANLEGRQETPQAGAMRRKREKEGNKKRNSEGNSEGNSYGEAEAEADRIPSGILAEAEAEAQGAQSPISKATLSHPAPGTGQGRKRAVKGPSQDIVTIFDHWRTVHNHPAAHLDAKRVKAIDGAMAIGYTVADLCLAIDGCAASPYHQGDVDAGNLAGKKFDALTLILRDGEHIDQFMALAPQEEPPKPPPTPWDRLVVHALRLANEHSWAPERLEGFVGVAFEDHDLAALASIIPGDPIVAILDIKDHTTQRRWMDEAAAKFNGAYEGARP